MLREGPGGKIRLAAGARERGNILGVMVPLPPGVEIILPVDDGGIKSEQQGTDKMPMIRD
jgi:hypothetical protein